MNNLLSKHFWCIILITGTLVVAAQNNTKSVNLKQYVLIPVSEKIFHLDDKTTARSKSVSYIEKEGLYACYTSYTRKITFFDYNTGKVKSEFFLSEKPDGIFIVSTDSIFMFSLDRKELFIQNNKNKKIWDEPFNLGKEIKTYTVNPELSHNEPVLLLNGSFYMTCWGLGEYPDVVKKRSDRPVIVEYNLKTKERHYYSGYPQFYIDNNMGGLNNYPLYHTVNRNKNEIVVSFGASNQVAVFNYKSKIEKLSRIKSNYFDTIPLPFPDKDRYYSSEREAFYFYITKPIYGTIIYDKYQKKYYRFVTHGVNKPDMSKGAKAFLDKPISIIVTDEDFRVLGETPKMTGYYAPQAFVNEKGLHLLKLTKDENKAVYTIFKVNETSIK
jgi:hypothetical protein